MNRSQPASYDSPLILSYQGTMPDAELLQWVRQGLVAGVVLFRDNCVDEALLRGSIAHLRSVSPRRLRVMIDEEGGRVRRLSDAAVSMRDLRDYADTPPHQVADAYRDVAERLVDLGIDTLLAPVVDVGDPGADWLNSRTFSNESARVAEMATAVIPAIEICGVHACAKHFPGSGRVRMDPHHGPAASAVTPAQFDTHERIPFEAAIAAGVRLILVGHQIMTGFNDNVPACLSRRIVTDLLRGQLAFNGAILTDDLAMGAIARSYPISDAVTRALEAGCQLLLVCNDREAQRAAVETLRERRVAI